MAMVNLLQKGGDIGTFTPTKIELDYKKIFSEALAPLFFEIGKLKDNICAILQGEKPQRQPQLEAEGRKAPDPRTDNETASLNNQEGKPDAVSKEELEERKLNRFALLAKLKNKRFQKDDTKLCVVSQNKKEGWPRRVYQDSTIVKRNIRRRPEDLQATYGTLGAVKMKRELNFKSGFLEKREC